jgi:hypothetical protein
LWPADLEKEPLVLYAPFTFRDRKLESGLSWVMGDSAPSRRARRRANWPMMINQGQFKTAVRSVLCGPGTAATELLERNGLYFWRFARFDADGQRVEEPNQVVWADILAANLRDIKLPSETPEPHEPAWEAGVYGLDRLIVLRPSHSANVEAGRRRLEVLAASSVYGGGPTVQLRGDAVRVPNGIEARPGPPTKKDLETANQGSGGPSFGGMGGGMAGRGVNNQGWLEWNEAVQTVELPTEFWDRVDVGFEARLGQVNEWTIPLPEELIKAVRDALRADRAPKPRPATTSEPGNS